MITQNYLIQFANNCQHMQYIVQYGHHSANQCSSTNQWISVTFSDLLKKWWYDQNFNVDMIAITVCVLAGVNKYLLIPRAWKIAMTWNMWHFFTLFGSLWYLAFQVTNKNIFRQNWGMWKKYPIFKYKWKYKGKSH